ncbi:Por secretion system C-terminal sorting domain-containing protein [Mesonia phycicola]|uniref:Por secretion system C-terminal sorting domain-containing protein n=1 Tax=Mesonia phycicola TaxID=579105 RepID=A0A1M6FD18_9FLAO|nr:T9SS type A sorting domain-containing protein [Mesonia phycicola]SHI95543.1 Por secretion system C-terminal sorting domain-containing protein [Mesonia phycicola]
MKKILLLLFTTILTIPAIAQISITDHSGNAITNGQEFKFSELGQLFAEVGIKITNNGSSDAYILGEVVSMSNASGSNLQFCLAEVCYATITSATSYPLTTPLTLAPGESNGDYDHFFNNYDGNDPSQPVVYEFRFYEVDASGNELGDIVSFSYTYDKTLSTKKYNLENIGITVYSSMVSDQFKFNTEESTTLKIYSLTGKKVYERNFNNGEQVVSTSKLSSGIYIIEFVTEKGYRAAKKIVKK